MLQLRNSRVSIARGSYEWPQAEGQRMAFQRRHGHEHTLVAFNYGREAAPLVLQGVQPGQRLRVLMPAGAMTGAVTAAAPSAATPTSASFVTVGADGGEPEPSAESSGKAIKRGKLTMDPARHECTWDGKNVRLTVTEFLLLQALAQRPGFVKSRDNLMDAAYDDQVYVDDRTIDSHIKRMRKKFRVVDPEFDAIETLYGVGYRYRE